MPYSPCAACLLGASHVPGEGTVFQRSPARKELEPQAGTEGLGVGRMCQATDHGGQNKRAKVGRGRAEPLQGRDLETPWGGGRPGRRPEGVLLV